MAKGYSELRNELVSAANGVGYAYRDTGGVGYRWSCSSTFVGISTAGTRR